MIIKNGKVWCGHKFKKEDKFSLAFFFYPYFLLGLFLCLLSFQTTSPSSHQSVKKNVHIGFGLDLKDLGLFQFGKELLVNHYYQDGFWKAGDTFIVDRRNIHITKSFSVLMRNYSQKNSNLIL